MMMRTTTERRTRRSGAPGWLGAPGPGPTGSGRSPAPALLALMTLAAMATPAAAQERGRDREREERVFPRAPLPPEAMAWRMSVSRRARMGITLGEDRGGTLEIQDVLEGGPADEAGLRPGDLILAFDGHALDEPLDDEAPRRRRYRSATPRLLHLLAQREPGDEVAVTYLRDGERRVTTLRLDENPRPETFRFERIDPRPPGAATPPLPPIVRLRGMRSLGRCPPGSGAAPFALRGGCLAGVALLELNPELGSYFGVTEGVLVIDADEANPLGLRAGDVILAVDGREVREPADVARVLDGYREDDEVTLRIRRQGEVRDVRGRVER